MTAPAYLVPLLGVALSIAGLLLVRRGRWPRRVGTTPHCSKCDYILTDLVTVPDQLPRCPECGTPATPWRIRLGERPIRPSLIWSGSALAVLGALLLTSLLSTSVRSFQWIHLEPLEWLLGDLDNGSPSTRERSWNEIMRRDNAGLLSEADKSMVVDRGLQSRPLFIFSHGDVIANYLAGRYLKNKLSDAQTDAFFARITDVQLTIRPLVGTKSPLPYVVNSLNPTPARWQLVMGISQTQVDDRAPERPQRRVDYYVKTAIEQHGAPPGMHRLRVRIKLLSDPHLGGTSVDLDNPVPGQHVITRDLSGTFKVVEGRTPIAVLTMPAAAELRRKIIAKVSPSHGDRADAISVYMEADQLPCNAPFAVSIRARGREYPIGNWVVKKDTNVGSYWFPEEATLDDLDGAEIVLRSDETLARRTVDLQQIWKGRIVIPVPKRKD